MLKNTGFALATILATLGSGVTGAPSIERRDGLVICGRNDDSGNPNPGNYRPVHGPDGYNVLIQQINGCCDATIGNKWISLGATEKCSVMLVGRQFADFTVGVLKGGFYADKGTCVSALTNVVTSCYDNDWNMLGGCRLSPDGNFRTCIWPHGDF